MNATLDIPKRLFIGLTFAGVATSVIGLFIAPDRAWSSLLVATFFLLSLGVGGAVFVALTYVTGAGWAVAFRRIPEAMARTLPFSGVAMLIVLALRMHAYGWHHHGTGDAGTFWFKELWLTPAFWMLRAVGYVLVWCVLTWRVVSISRRQDDTPGNDLTLSAKRFSALFLAIYAVTFSLAGIDWFMALEPMWFSTMWGVYHFSGMILAALAVIVILGLQLRRPHAPLHGVFNDEHLHDLGKLLIGFSCFWMYIWFSQYMLIWYSNLPEETFYFVSRTRGAWGPVLVLNIILNWVIPFFVLLPRPAKRSAGVMMKVAVVLLLGRAVDLYLMVYPSTIGEAPVLGLWEAGAVCAVIGAGGLLLAKSFLAAPAVPKRDPFLSESLSYHC